MRWINGLSDLGTAGLCRISQLSLLRLLNQPKVMEDDVCTSAEAWLRYDSLLADDRFSYHAEPVDLDIALRQFTNNRNQSPKLWPDAYLAAFAYAAGLTLVTFDTGFRQFPIDCLILAD